MTNKMESNLLGSMDAKVERLYLHLETFTGSDSVSIFTSDKHMLKTLYIIANVATKVNLLNLPTTFSRNTVTLPTRQNIERSIDMYMQRHLRHIADRDDATFVACWLLAAANWRYMSDEHAQHKVFRTLLSMIYGIDLPDIFKLQFQLSNEVQKVNGISIVCPTNLEIESSARYMLDSVNGSLFMLVTSFLGMVGKPERHLFSTKCNCISCMNSPEYTDILNTQYVIKYPLIEDHSTSTFVFINTGNMNEALNRMLVCKDTIPVGDLVMIYQQGGVVMATDLYYVDDIIDELNRRYRNSYSSGALFMVNNDMDEDIKNLMHYLGTKSQLYISGHATLDSFVTGYKVVTIVDCEIPAM